MQATPLLFDAPTGAVAGLKDNATVIVCSTVAPAYVAELAVRMEEAGRADLKLVDCPVSGGPGRAARGTLSLFSAGDDEALEAPGVQGVLGCLGDKGKLYRVPGPLGAGSKAKLMHQIFAGVHIAVASEVMGLAAVAGLDTRRVFEEVRGGEGGSWLFGDRVAHMLEPGLGRYSAVGIIAKDVGIVGGMARGMGVPLPVMGVAEQLFLSAMGRGWGEEDDCVVVRLYLGGREGLVVERAGRAEAEAEGAGVSVGEIRDLLVGVHLAVVSEVMAFCERLGVDVELMFDIVSNAAGASRVFERYFGDMKGRGWGVKGVPGVEEIRDRLVSMRSFFWTDCCCGDELMVYASRPVR